MIGFIDPRKFSLMIDVTACWSAVARARAAYIASNPRKTKVVLTLWWLANELWDA